MLVQHPQTHGTLILQRDGSGRLNATGPENLSLGYSVTRGSGTASSTFTEQYHEDGVWARWAWNGSTLTVTNDRFGFLPVYFAELQNGFAVSTSIPALLKAGASTTLNDAAIAVFLRLGYYVGNDTPFANIKLLPPCSRLTWNGSTYKLTQSAPAIPAASRHCPAMTPFDFTVNGFRLQSRHAAVARIQDVRTAVRGP